MLAALPANAYDWLFCRESQRLLREYVPLESGIPSHDTMQKVFSSIKQELMQNLASLQNEQLNSVNMLRKLALSIPKLFVLINKYSLKKKHFTISCTFGKCFEWLCRLNNKSNGLALDTASYVLREWFNSYLAN